MDVRCVGCRREVSEWAARCPLCGRPLDDAEVQPGLQPVELAPGEMVRRASIGDGAPAEAAQGEAAHGEAAQVEAAQVEAAQVEVAQVEAAQVETVPAEIGPPRWLDLQRVRRRPVGLVAVAVALVAVVALALGAFAPGQGGPTAAGSKGGEESGPPPTMPAPPSMVHSPHGSVLGRLPGALASERLFFADPTKTGLYRADGQKLTDLTMTPGEGYPLVPLVSSRGVVVYIHGDYAYRTDPRNRRRVVQLAPASWIFPAEHGAIGIESGGEEGPASVTYMAANGAFPERGTPSVILAPGITAIAQVPSGLIVAAGATLAELLNQVTRVTLSLIEAHTTVNLGTATSVLGISGPTLALVTCPSRGMSSCVLRLVNTTTQRVRTIRPPPGYSGFAQGGGFAPNGKLLATFVPSPGGDRSTVLHLALIRLSTGVATVGRLRLAARDELVGDATWSADGHWLYFGSLSGPLDAQQVSRSGPSGSPWTLPLTASLAVIGA